MTEEQVQQIRAWWEIFQQGRRLTEIRIIGKYTRSGYYKNVENLIRDVSACEGEGAVYFVINDPKEACYDKPQREQMSGEKKLSTTSDKEIERILQVKHHTLIQIRHEIKIKLQKYREQ